MKDCLSRTRRGDRVGSVSGTDSGRCSLSSRASFPAHNDAEPVCACTAQIAQDTAKRPRGLPSAHPLATAPPAARGRFRVRQTRTTSMRRLPARMNRHGALLASEYQASVRPLCPHRSANIFGPGGFRGINARTMGRSRKDDRNGSAWSAASNRCDRRGRLHRWDRVASAARRTPRRGPATRDCPPKPTQSAFLKAPGDIGDPRV